MRREQSFGEASGVERAPEAIARSRKVISGGGTVETRIDAAEENFQIARDHIGHGLARRGEQFIFRRLAWLTHSTPPFDSSAILHLKPQMRGERLARIVRHI